MSTQVLLIGFDAVSKPSIERLISAGKLPNLASLRNQGWWSGLTNEGLSGAVWPSLYSGCSVSRHGHYFYNQIKSGTYKMAIQEEGDYCIPCFWERLGKANKRVAVIDAPKTKLSDTINGMQVINWASHDPDAFNRFDAFPPGLRQHIRQHYPNDPVGKNDWGGSGPSDILRFKQALVQNIRRRTKLALDYLHKEDWDLFFTMFDDAHQLGHLTWHLHDRQHPRWDPLQSEQYGDPVEEMYVEIDRAIGEILSSVDDDTTVIVFNNLGMGPNYTAKGLIECFLRSMNGKSDPSGGNHLQQGLAYLWRHLPLVLHKYLWQFQIAVRESLFSHKRAESRYFFLPLNEDNSGIRINLKGREPDGIVPEADYETVCSELVAELKKIHDPDSGRSLVKKIILSRESFSGEKLDLLPDIIIEWNSEQPYTRAKWSKGAFEHKPHEWRTGSHRPDGFIVARGENFAPGVHQQTSSVLDIAPTLYAFFGLDDIESDGKVLPGFHQK
jgi:predicted AlkP superfamily phosphohydrolase/phosphomutase